MFAGRFAGGIAVILATGLAHAEEPAAAPVPPPPVVAPAPARPAPPAAGPSLEAKAHGAIVVAVGADSGPAARSLATEVYRDAGLRPTIDEPTAQVLAGGAAPAGASPRLKEIAELRASLSSGTDVVNRRLIGSLGAELGAELVLVVTMDGTRPVARVVRPQLAGAPDRPPPQVELGATIQIAPDGQRTFQWVGAVTTLQGLIRPAAPFKVAPDPAPLPPPPVPNAPKPFYKSAWFWGTLGGVAAVGLTVLVLSKTTGGSNDVHLIGKIGP